MRALWEEAWLGLRARGRRTLLSALGIVMAAAMLSTASVVGYGLSSGFTRSASANDLPDVIAHFDDEPLSRIRAKVDALPNLAATTFHLEVTNSRMGTREHFARNGVIEVINPGRRGYAVLAGHDLAGHAGEVLIENGVARAWDLHPGSTLFIEGLGRLTVSGVVQSSDNVAYPIATPRVYLSRIGLDARFGTQRQPRVNVVELWARDRGNVNTLLDQARENAYGIRGLSFVTRDGVRVLVDQAAGIVIALLVALSVIALITAAVMLAASARADVQRRLAAIGVRRAVGATRGRIVALGAAEASIVAVPAAAIGVLIGALVASGPSDDLLSLLNERPPGAAVLLPLIGCWLLAAAIPVAASAWPSWRATARAPITLLRGAELGAAGGSYRGSRSLMRLGSRLATARRARLAATLAVLGTSAAFILLMLALASELSFLENDPSALGKRYQLLSLLPASAVAKVKALPGVADASARYELTGADSFALGETIDVIAYPGDHVPFEAPPLASGHRISGPGQVEVGTGLAEVLGLRPGSTLALALPSGNEARFTVAGTVSSLDHDGRVAFVSASALLRPDPAAPEQIAVRLDAGADSSKVSSELTALGAQTSKTATVTGRGAALVAALKSILRAVAGVDGLVCLYTLIQALALMASERRSTIAVLRAFGAGPRSVVALLTGAGVAVVLPAAVVGVVLERLLLGPAMARIAASYVTLPLGAGVGVIALVVVGLLALSAIAVVWVSRQATREPIASGLPT